MIDTKLLCEVADRLSAAKGWGLCGSKWQNAEAEVIADQTIRASANNFRDHGEAFSWATHNAISGSSGCGLIDNGAGLAKIGGDILLESYTGSLQPKDPEGIAKDENGNFKVFRVTPNLLAYVDVFTRGTN